MKKNHLQCNLCYMLQMIRILKQKIKHFKCNNACAELEIKIGTSRKLCLVIDGRNNFLGRFGF